MPALVTDRLKKEIILNLIKDVEARDSDENLINSYHIGIGQPIQWDENDTTPTPINNTHDIRDAQYNLLAVKQVEAFSFVVPRRNWSNGAFYRSWSDKIVGHPFQDPFYVITENNEVYVCVQQGRDENGERNRSTVQPNNTSPIPFQTSDNYVWKFLYTVGPGRSRLFLSANYFPVTKFEQGMAGDPDDQQSQFGIQGAAVPGQVIGYEVLEGGRNYQTPPTIEVIGDGSGARAVGVVNGGSLVDVKLADSGTSKAFGSGYKRASVSITGGGGTDAKARAILGPAAGLGADPRDDLKATSIMFSASPEGTEQGAFLTDNDFRQILLIKNIQIANSNNVYEEVAGNALRKMTIGPVNQGPFTRDSRIRGINSNAEAYVVTTEPSEIFYIQDSDTGFKDFIDGETLNEVEGTAETQVTDHLVKGAVDVETGEVIYIDNRTEAISRSDDQTEDIKVIIDL